MVPMRLFRGRAFSATNGAALLMNFGMFGTMFLLAQFFQIVQGYSRLEAGLRALPWTAMQMVVAPIAGMLSNRIGAVTCWSPAWRSWAAGWHRWPSSPPRPICSPYIELVPAFVMAGVGISLYLRRSSSTRCCRPVERKEEGKAGGVNMTVREVGGVFGVARCWRACCLRRRRLREPADLRDGVVAGDLGRRGRRGARRRRCHRSAAASGRGATIRCRCSRGRAGR